MHSHYDKRDPTRPLQPKLLVPATELYLRFKDETGATMSQHKFGQLGFEKFGRDPV